MSDRRSICAVTGESFVVSPQEIDIIERISCSSNYLGAALPLPVVKPAECVRQAYAFGNIRFLSRCASIRSGKPQISRFVAEDGYRILSPDEFWSEETDNCTVGRPFDFSRTFNEQYAELLHTVEHLALSAVNCEGCEWTNGVLSCQDCYLVFSADNSRDCMYCVMQYSGHDNIACVGSKSCRFCYECVDVDLCYQCQHCQDCFECNDCVGCFDCRSCELCLGCIGLDREKYCIFNQKVPAAEFERRHEEFKLSSRIGRQRFLEQFTQELISASHPARRQIAVDSCSGAYNRRSKDLHQCFFSDGSEDCGFLIIAMRSKDCWKGFAIDSELNYHSGVVRSHTTGYSYALWDCHDCWYSYHLFNNCVHCFACAALKGKSYCILNRQYSREEYFELLPRIVKHMQTTGEWGRYFTPSIAPHAYHESFAEDFLQTLSDQELAKRGYRLRQGRKEEKVSNHPSANTTADVLSELVDIEALCAQTYASTQSGQPFRYQRKELEFYQRFSIPLPSITWQERLEALLNKRERMGEAIG